MGTLVQKWLTTLAELWCTGCAVGLWVAWQTGDAVDYELGPVAFRWETSGKPAGNRGKPLGNQGKLVGNRWETAWKPWETAGKP